ncbi:MAG: cellulose-binding protein [Nannocystis sp.]|nr:hypothetical protein [Nannocystis sp.]MBA3548016.1 cellulose-binding protein [Nannocystis sp.]
MNLSLQTATLAAAALLACGGTSGTDTETHTTTTALTTTGTPTTTADATTTSDATTTDTGTGPDPTTVTTTATDSTDTTSTTGAAITCADLPLCEDFEDSPEGAPPDPAVWTVAAPNCMGTGKLAVAGDQAHSGARSLRVDGGGGYCDHIFIANTAAITGLGDQIYGRFYLRLTDALGQGHVTFLTLKDSADGGKDLRMGGQSTILMYNRESDDATLPALSPAGIAMSAAPAPGQWTCIEFLIDEAAGHITTWVDDVEVAGLRVDGEPTPDLDQQWLNKPDWKPQLEDIKFGWESYAGQSMVLHFDDLALAGARIGCD